ncbi:MULTISPECIES: hypothetical protein [Alicyclobacillus]|uniref:Uncharacterized protein n=1 Tax=Alicyclobacillus acidocaldarius subsp. acidocaldarius (strain ATCC 27009 / DSM 446 / BCRC 14685 / JCM 5260 / KCTC 1825 / NBRC 15652 / NCIMB 11725 / NRRL B-14509 / 104-IA) TaxID=521098 RepID=C8WUJ1_ALIAD|nr:MULTISPECIES: hypothetical protein [Alicyclobacillus]ACV59807.1 hypothetical protein Aaci_2803 [Alicyclobacillus acidocaldarius subsp. acidocaldarius DSM 446]
MKVVRKVLHMFVVAFVGLSLMLFTGFALLVCAAHREWWGAIGGALMVLAAILAAAIDIRLRSPEVRQS